MTIFISCLLYGFLWLIAWLPLRVLYLFSDFLFISIYYLFPYRKKLVYENLKHAFPEKDPHEIKSIAKKYYKHFADSVLESFYMIHMSLNENSLRYKYKNLALLEELFNKGKSVVLLMPHYGNWEWLAGLDPKSPLHFLAVYKPLTNSCFDRLFIRIRERFGGETIPMRKILRKIIESEKKNELNITLFLYDQRPVPGEITYWVKFLHQETPVILGAEKIAKRFNQPVVFLKTKRIKRGYYENEFIELYRDPAATDKHEITDKYYSLLEEMINEAPEYWLWSHNRWKFNAHEELISPK